LAEVNAVRLASRVMEFVEATRRDPFQGTGSPEPLELLGADVWSRRVNDEHRMIYVVQHERITFVQARYHYGR
jgi:toxin YoeB